VQQLDTASLGAAVGSFFAALALFAVPVTLLGMVSPFAIRLALAAGLLLGARWHVLTIAFAALLAVPPGAVKSAHGVIYERESRYQYVDVRELADGSRVLELNEGVVTNSLWYPGSVLTGGEWDMFLVVPPLVPHPVRSALVLGNAGGSTARALAALYPRVAVDGVEIDPAVTEAARRYLDLGGIPRLHVVTADARAYLRGTGKRYDLIAIDVYRQPYIPFQVATREFFSEVRSHLTPGGCIALNVARLPDDRGLLDAVAATVRDVFDQAWEWDALRFNSLLFACNGHSTRAELVRRVGDIPAAASSLAPLFRREVTESGFRGTVLTDDRAPVEWLSDRAIVSYVAHGGRLEEDHLPTQP